MRSDIHQRPQGYHPVSEEEEDNHDDQQEGDEQGLLPLSAICGHFCIVDQRGKGDIAFLRFLDVIQSFVEFIRNVDIVSPGLRNNGEPNPAYAVQAPHLFVIFGSELDFCQVAQPDNPITVFTDNRSLKSFSVVSLPKARMVSSVLFP